MDKQLIKKLLNYEFYADNKAIIMRDFFSSNLALIYDSIVRAHEKYNTDLKVSWVKALHFEHLSLTEAQRQVVSLIFNELEKESDVPDAVAADLITSMYIRSSAQKAANEALKVINGQVKDLTALEGVLATLRSEAPKDKSYSRVDIT